MTTKKLLASFAATALVTAMIALPAAKADDDKDTKQKVQQDHKQTTQDADKHGKDKHQDHANDAEKSKDKAAKGAAAELGKPAPSFSLTDTDGATIALGDVLKDGKKIVVLEWFNPTCPFILKHHEKNKTFNDLYAKYHEKGVEFYAVNSGSKGNQGSGLEANKQAKTDFALPYPILLDESGATGQAYGAKTTPHVFIIAKDGTLAYRGAIDDDPSQKVGKTNYAAKALDELLAGTNVTTPETKPYGCAVKYGASSSAPEKDQKPKNGPGK